MQTTERISNDEYFANEGAELKKQKFLKFVEALIKLRELQFESEIGEGTLERAQRILARNLPSNLLRAAAIFVDHAYGFPPGRKSFRSPRWTSATEILDKHGPNPLDCEFCESRTFEEKDVVVLVRDISEGGLHAGMAGIVREVADEDDILEKYRVEFGEPEESITTVVEVPRSLLRGPRPGDLLENFRL